MEIPVYRSIEEAHERIRPFIHRTPVMKSGIINALTGGDIYFKCENFQKVGAFKYRGATNAVLSLSNEQAAKGVATHSSGNHAQALALAAAKRGITAHIVMPENAPSVKIEAVKGYGGIVTFCEPTLAARESTLEKIISETAASFIHPYNNHNVICGQGTAVKELIEENGPFDIIMAPVGGGGLLSGTSLTARAINPHGSIYGAEPSGADDAARSLKAGRLIPQSGPQTICDGLLTSLAPVTFEIISRNVTGILTAGEDSIRQAMKLIWERMKIVAEPSGCVPLAVILENRSLFEGWKTGVIISGGNADLSGLLS